MSSGLGLHAAHRDGIRRVFSTLGVLVVVAGAVFGADVFGVRESVLGRATPSPRAVAVSPFVSVGGSRARTKSVLRSQPWWQGVSDLRGDSSTTKAAFQIDGGASQWRAKWSCLKGRLIVQVPAQAQPLVDSVCPGAGTAYATRTGPTGLQIAADGPWRLQVDQQVDVPLDEPPLPVMSATGTAVALAGTFNGIDQKGIGYAAVYRDHAGHYTLRLTNFYVSPNVDLEIRLSPLAAPHSTRQFLAAKSVLVAPLDVTAGSLNFKIPVTIDPTRYRSLVIWCPLVTSAYAAAPLTPSR